MLQKALTSWVKNTIYIKWMLNVNFYKYVLHILVLWIYAFICASLLTLLIPWGASGCNHFTEEKKRKGTAQVLSAEHTERFHRFTAHIPGSILQGELTLLKWKKNKRELYPKDPCIVWCHLWNVQNRKIRRQKVDWWLLRARRCEGRWGMTANAYTIFCKDDENVLKLIIVMDAQFLNILKIMTCTL